MRRLLLGAVYFNHACSLSLLAHHGNEVQDGGGQLRSLLLGAVGRGRELGDEHLVDDVENALQLVLTIFTGKGRTKCEHG